MKKNDHPGIERPKGDRSQKNARHAKSSLSPAGHAIIRNKDIAMRMVVKRSADD